MSKDNRKAWTRAFPRDLLSAPATDRVSWFDNRAVSHERMTRVRMEVRRLLRGGRRYPLILVVGPTGIGKSTLVKLLKKEITDEIQPSLSLDPGRIPIASVEASAIEKGVFHWRDHFVKCLEELRDVLIFNKLDDDDCEICRGKPRHSENLRLSASSFRHALEHALVHRRPVAFFIDEAQHLTKMSSGRRLLDQMDIIKSIANCTQIPHVLFGTYDLLALRNLNGQLSRRNFEVHFGRYRIDDKNDLVEFKKVLRSFENLLPTKEKPCLEQHWEFMYERSLGCVGILKEWLTRALERAVDDNSPVISHSHLERAAMSVTRCHTIASEIIHGEERLAEDSKARPQLLSLLGLKTSVKTQKEIQPITSPVEQQAEHPELFPLTSSTQKLRPFEQKPKRHVTDPKKRFA